MVGTASNSLTAFGYVIYHKDPVRPVADKDNNPFIFSYLPDAQEGIALGNFENVYDIRLTSFYGIEDGDVFSKPPGKIMELKK